ncbi:MAG TPA: hypothetical protein V6D33_10060 [Cyanophyceae cyanobacterium]
MAYSPHTKDSSDAAKEGFAVGFCTLNRIYPVLSLLSHFLMIRGGWQVRTLAGWQVGKFAGWKVGWLVCPKSKTSTALVHPAQYLTPLI